ncbi:MAG TPA: LacI family transcriptional regulator, partial [Spirochaetia bacterium]|nr:LacI family transcriptional regulator [Spirochaetia bacterium]
MKALEDNNLKIPDDISVVGIDDIPDAEKSSPSLTTIRVPAEEIGEIAGKKIIEMLFEEKNIIQKIELGTELMIRESSGPAKVN